MSTDSKDKSPFQDEVTLVIQNVQLIENSRHWISLEFVIILAIAAPPTTL